jgi:ABC-type antimicrobial peptide transport system permease subunit
MLELFGAPEKAATDEGFVVTAKPGVSKDALGAALDQHITHDIDAVTLPQDVVFLRAVRTLPIALAGFLILLAIAAVGHALASTVRRRRHELAVLRAIGFRPRQSAACIAALAATVGIIGLVLGIPLGVAAGRLTWHWVAERTPLLYVAPIATVAVLLSVPITLLLANALAAYPARRAARISTAEVLRTE